MANRNPSGKKKKTVARRKEDALFLHPPKKKRGKKRPKAGAGMAVAVISAIVLILIVVFLGASQYDDLAEGLQNAWQATLEQLQGTAGVDSAARELANLEEHSGMLLYVVDTGNSDCMIVRSPEGNAMLVDAADDDDYRSIARKLRALDIERLDAVVYMPEIEKSTATFHNMIEEIEANDVEQVYAVAADTFMLGSIDVRVLHPQPGEYDDANDASVVLLLTYKEHKVLLTGDIEPLAINELLENQADYLDVDVLKIAHHGSARSTTQEWLSATTPELALINAGEGNDYGHPHRETIELLKQNNITILRTDQNGDIAVFIEDDGIDYATAA